MSLSQSTICSWNLLKCLFLSLLLAISNLKAAERMNEDVEEQARTRLCQDIFHSLLRQIPDRIPAIDSSSKIFVLYDMEAGPAHTTEVENFCEQMLLAGIDYPQILFEPWAHRAGGKLDNHQYADELFKAKKVIVIGSPELKEKYERGIGRVKPQLTNLFTRDLKSEQRGAILINLRGRKEDCFPAGLQHLTPHNLSVDPPMAAFFDFLVDLYELPYAHQNPIRSLKEKYVEVLDIPIEEIRDEAARILRRREEQAAARAQMRRDLLNAAQMVRENEEKARSVRWGGIPRASTVNAVIGITPLSLTDLGKLWRSRTYNGEQAKVTLIGGGVSGIFSALDFALLKDENGHFVFDVHVVEADPHLMNGASKLISRLHLGNEYPTHEETALQCLFGATLFNQQLQTNQVFTPQKFLDFLIAKKTMADGKLTPEVLVQHNERLKAQYAKYLEQIKEKYGDRSESLLFGPSATFFEQLEELPSDHFGFGLRTKEKGLQPIGFGVVLENLLEKLSRTQPNLHIHRATEVRNIQQIPGGGFEVITSSSRPLYTRYLVNASWHNIPTLNRLMSKTSRPHEASSGTKVYLRTLAYVNARACGFSSPDNSYFGLLAEEGGMCCRFPGGAAALFVPAANDDAVEYSYQGYSVLNEDVASASAIPFELKDRYEELNSKGRKRLAEEILGNGERENRGARTKYPQLTDAAVITSVTRTTLSKSATLAQREHMLVDWVNGVKDCLQVAAAKGTFAPFVGLQAVARFLKETPEGRRVKLSKQAWGFLDGLLEGDMLTNALLPEEFVLVHSGEDIGASDFTEAMRRYAFHRQLPFSIFENSDHVTQEQQLRVLNWGDTIDLAHHDLTTPMIEALMEVLTRRAPVDAVKLGTVFAENKLELESIVLNKLREFVGEMRSLTLKGWDINSSSLGWILPHLEEFVGIDARVDFMSVRSTLFAAPDAFPLRKLALVNCRPNAYTLKELFGVLPKLRFLEDLDLSSNDIGRSLPDAEFSLAKFIEVLPSINKLSLRDNNLFASVRILDASKSYSVLDEPNVVVLLRALERKASLRFVDLSQNNLPSVAVQEAVDFFFASKSSQ
jgi:hypothetical protein